MERRSGGAVSATTSAGGAHGRISGVAIVFDAPTMIGDFREIIRPQAVDRMLRSSRDLKLLWNHDTSLVLGARASGTLRVQKTREGLAFDLHPPKWAAPQVESIARRDVTGCSFGFYCLVDNWRMEGDVPVREVLDAEILEITVTAFPAYQQTTVSASAADRAAEMLKTLHRIRLAR